MFRVCRAEAEGSYSSILHVEKLWAAILKRNRRVNQPITQLTKRGLWCDEVGFMSPSNGFPDLMPYLVALKVLSYPRQTCKACLWPPAVSPRPCKLQALPACRQHGMPHGCRLCLATEPQTVSLSPQPYCSCRHVYLPSISQLTTIKLSSAPNGIEPD